MLIMKEAKNISREAKKIVRQKLRKPALAKLSRNGNTCSTCHQTNVPRKQMEVCHIGPKLSDTMYRSACVLLQEHQDSGNLARKRTFSEGCLWRKSLIATVAADTLQKHEDGRIRTVIACKGCNKGYESVDPREFDKLHTDTRKKVTGQTTLKFSTSNLNLDSFSIANEFESDASASSDADADASDASSCEETDDYGDDTGSKYLTNTNRRFTRSNKRRRDTVEHWYNADKCNHDGNHVNDVSPKEAHRRYKKHCDEHSKYKPLGKNEFYNIVEQKGHPFKKHHANYNVFHNLQLKDVTALHPEANKRSCDSSSSDETDETEVNTTQSGKKRPRQLAADTDSTSQSSGSSVHANTQLSGNKRRHNSVVFEGQRRSMRRTTAIERYSTGKRGTYIKNTPTEPLRPEQQRHVDEWFTLRCTIVRLSTDAPDTFSICNQMRVKAPYSYNNYCKERKVEPITMKQFNVAIREKMRYANSKEQPRRRHQSKKCFDAILFECCSGDSTCGNNYCLQK